MARKVSGDKDGVFAGLLGPLNSAGATATYDIPLG